jgi:hypothetical protein
MLQGFAQDAEREPVQLVPPQILIRCNFCNKMISESRAVNAANGVSTSLFIL